MFFNNWKCLLSLNHLRILTPRNVVFITGCDSGLGFNLALFCHSLNMTVVSGCHNINSEGANIFKNLSDRARMIPIEIDLLKSDTIVNARILIQSILELNPDFEFTALVNNAGVMCFGEFEWQTQNLIESQINVNLCGTMRITKELLPLIRSHKGRIITVTSHCGLQALPTLAPYAASKAGLRVWNDSLRIEMQQYGVKVINFVPGSFTMNSNIASRQQQQAEEMKLNFTPDQRQFYEKYFDRFNNYLNIISGYKKPQTIDDPQLFMQFKCALLSNSPKPIYIHETWRYKIYRILIMLCPTRVSDWLAVNFALLPRYNPNDSESSTNNNL